MDPLDIANPLHPLSPIYAWGERGHGRTLNGSTIAAVMLGTVAAVLAVAGLATWLVLRLVRRVTDEAEAQVRRDLLRAGVHGMPRPSSPAGWLRP